MQFIDIKKSKGTWQVFTCPDTANSLLSFIFSRHVTSASGEALIPLQLSLLPQLCMWPLPSFLIKLWQALIVCLSGYYSGNLLTWMLTDRKISFSLCFVCVSSQTQAQNWTVWVMTRNQSLKRLVIDRIFLCRMLKMLMTDFIFQFLDELPGNLIFSVHLLLWLRHNGKLKGQIQLTNRTWIPAKDTYSSLVGSLRDQTKLLLWLALVYPLKSPASGHAESNPLQPHWENYVE